MHIFSVACSRLRYASQYRKTELRYKLGQARYLAVQDGIRGERGDKWRFARSISIAITEVEPIGWSVLVRAGIGPTYSCPVALFKMVQSDVFSIFCTCTTFFYVGSLWGDHRNLGSRFIRTNRRTFPRRFPAVCLNRIPRVATSIAGYTRARCRARAYPPVS